MLQQAAGRTLPMWEAVRARTIEAMPAVAASLLVIGAGVFLGWLARRLVERVIAGRGAWREASLGIGGPLDAWSRPHVAGRTAQWLVIFCSTIVALYAVDPRLASILAERVLLYVPRLASAVIIVAGGVLLSRFAGRSVLIAAVNHDIHPARLLASLTRAALVVIAVAVGLEHAGIGQRTVLVAFAILFGGVTLAGAIALGLALQDPLRRWLWRQASSASAREREEEPLHHV
jgi:hypothetical protein